VPYNPYNFRKHLRWAEAIVSFAGPLSNLVIALVGGFAIRAGVNEALFPLVFYVVAINTSLFLLNMLPIPPLDGSKVLSSILPRPLSYRYDMFRAVIEQNAMVGFVLIFVFINIFSGVYSSVVISLASAIAGL
jgi:Zn-dependent protease